MATDEVFTERDTWARRLAPLYARPGEWASVGVLKKDAAKAKLFQLRDGRVKDVSPGDFVFRTARVPNAPGLRIIEAKWLGPACTSCGAISPVSPCPLCGYDKET